MLYFNTNLVGTPGPGLLAILHEILSHFSWYTFPRPGRDAVGLPDRCTTIPLRKLSQNGTRNWGNL